MGKKKNKLKKIGESATLKSEENGVSDKTEVLDFDLNEILEREDNLNTDNIIKTTDEENLDDKSIKEPEKDVSSDKLDNEKKAERIEPISVKIDEKNTDDVKTTKSKKKEKKAALHSNDKHNGDKYIGYEIRVALALIAFIICLALSSIFLSKSFNVQNNDYVNYRESGGADYKVYLKKNDFYDQEYLGKDMVYVASLIKKIGVDFNYSFDISQNCNAKFRYDVVGRLVIRDTNGEHTFFEKEYKLVDGVEESINKQNRFSLNKNINIDYDYYNDLANKFKSNYGVDTTSSLIVSLKIQSSSGNDDNFDLNNNNAMSLTIPLSEKSINIKLDQQDINKSGTLKNKNMMIKRSYINIVLAIVFIALTGFFCIKTMKLLSYLHAKKSPYDKYIDKILREYDRLIVETSTVPSFEQNKVIKVERFQELLDVRDNLKLPIKYYVINKHQKSYFYISHDEEVYLLTVKAVDVENGKAK